MGRHSGLTGAVMPNYSAKDSVTLAMYRDKKRGLSWGQIGFKHKMDRNTVRMRVIRLMRRYPNLHSEPSYAIIALLKPKRTTCYDLKKTPGGRRLDGKTESRAERLQRRIRAGHNANAAARASNGQFAKAAEALDAVAS